MSEFKTRTIGLASFLSYAGIPHIATIRVYQKSYEFVFSDPEDACRRLEYEYLSGCSVADAMALLEADKQLKQTIKIASADGARKLEFEHKGWRVAGFTSNHFVLGEHGFLMSYRVAESTEGRIR